LPSIFTLSSLFLGYLAFMQIIKGNFVNAVKLITVSVILDGFDGTVARLTKTESNFGVQLDSLVDAVTFGMVTSIMIYVWGFQEEYRQLGKVIGFLFLSAGIIRLARFNIMKEAETFASNIFIGLPIPIGAMSICSFVLIMKRPITSEYDVVLFSVFVILVSFLMISNIKYRTMKRIKSKNSLFVLFFLAVIIALLINFPDYTIPLITFVYLISPVFFLLFKKTRKSKPAESDSLPPPGDS
jgi:CDP-diacylglycerol--serine O-phosphatidyltransferase